MNTRFPRIAVRLVFTIALASLGARSIAGAENTPVADLERGRHVATALAGCAYCHGANFAGGRAFTRRGVTIIAANLTSGAGGLGAASDADLRRAIRTGVAFDGTRLRIMPAREFAALTDFDMSDLIAFLRSLPPVDNIIARPARGTPATGAAPPDHPELTDRALPDGLTGGAYLATIAGCTNCHGAGLTGGIDPAGAAAPNISHSGIGTWTFGDFQSVLRTGKTPAGRMLSSAMPWQKFLQMTDSELRAIYDYLEAQNANS